MLDPNTHRLFTEIRDKLTGEVLLRLGHYPSEDASRAAELLDVTA